MSGGRLQIRGDRVGFERLAPFRYLFLGVLALCTLGGVVAAAAAITYAPYVALAFSYLAAPVISALVALHMRGLNAFAGFRGPATVRIGRGVLLLETRPVRAVPFADIAEGWTTPLEPNVVVVRLKNGDLASFDCPGEAEANRALAALGVATGQRTVRVRLQSRAARAGLQTVGALGVIVGAPVLLSYAVMLLVEGGSTLVALASLAAVAGAVAASRSLIGEIAIAGTDGITVRGLFGSRFVPFEGITAASYLGGAVRLERGGGADVVLPAKAEAGELLASRAQEALDRTGAARVAEAKLAQLDRRDETIAAWRARVAAQHASSGYRDLGIDKDEILEVLDDPACSPERRIAAALALSGDEDERTVKRLRVAVDACANEDLRAALELAAEGELNEPRLSHALRPKAPNG